MGHHIEVEYTHQRDEADCTAVISFDIQFEGPDYSVGLWGGWFLNDEVPPKCAECGHAYTEEEREAIGNLADKQAEDYDPEPDGPEDYED